jgi:hypothetical protein
LPATDFGTWSDNTTPCSRLRGRDALYDPPGRSLGGGAILATTKALGDLAGGLVRVWTTPWMREQNLLKHSGRDLVTLLLGAYNAEYGWLVAWATTQCG